MRADLPLPRVRSSGGSALLITLVFLALVTIFVTALVSIMVDEGGAARSHRDRQGALEAANEGFGDALSTLRTALDTADALTNASGVGFWSSQPGAIVRFNPDGSTNEVYHLYSGAGPAANGAVTNAPSDQVDVNAEAYDGSHMVGGSSATAPMKVGWINVLRDGGSDASKGNPVVARYAYWIDDESSRVNVNTADGTQRGVWGKYGPGTGTNSYGAGFPTEVNLAALGGTFSSRASQIVSNAWQRGFDTEGGVLGQGVSSVDYQSNRFNLTAFARSPEMNAFGEPKIFLLAATASGSATSGVTNAMIGPQNLTTTIQPFGLPLAQIYPSSVQVTNFTSVPAIFKGLPVNFVFPMAGYSTNKPGTLPQFFPWVPYNTGRLTTNNWQTYAMVARVAQYLKGYNSRGTAVAWPSYPGYAGKSFAEKYTDRQLDSIAFQIVQQASANTFADANVIHGTAAGQMMGPLSGELVAGVARNPHLTQILVGITATSSNVAVPTVLPNYTVTYVKPTALALSFTLYLEWFFPPQARGVATVFPSATGVGGAPGALGANVWNSANTLSTLNSYDLPLTGTNTFTTVVGGITTVASNILYPVAASGVSTNAGVLVPHDYWMSNLLRITDATPGSPNLNAEAGVDLMGLPQTSLENPDPVHQARVARDHPWCLDIATLTNSMKANPGDPTKWTTNYFGAMTGMGNSSRPALTMFTRLSPNTTNTPGYSFLTRPGSPIYLTRTNVTAVNVSGGLSIWNSLVSSQVSSGPLEAVPLDSLHGPAIGETMASAMGYITNGVLPINVSNLSAGQTKWVHLWVDDPYVNKFPGDWHVDADSSLATQNTIIGNSTIDYSNYYYPGYTTNTTFSWARAHDWESLAMAAQDLTIPKSQRLPGAGALQNIRTGMMPDIGSTNLSADQMHGTPWRTLDFGTNQVTSGGKAYPDWAMLDLFTVPVTPQPMPQSGAASPPPRDLTWGGSTAGRINPNGSVLAPWGIGRTVPLSAVLLGMNYADAKGVTNSLAAPDVQKIVAGITNYISANGPFRTAGEVANVPAVAAYTLDSGRNDVAKQLAGLLTTRSSVFSIWVVGQTIQKSARNTQPGLVESGDVVTGTTRVRYVVERYLDPGADGLIGNARSRGADGLVGTWDDPVTSTAPNVHPYNPTYRYRVIYAEPVGQ